MVKYDPLKDRSESCGWKKVQDETPPSAAEQAAWVTYILWFVAVFCVVTPFVFMDKPVW